MLKKREMCGTVRVAVMTGGRPLRCNITYITLRGEGVVLMTVYEAIMVMLTFGLLLITLLSYIDKRK